MPAPDTVVFIPAWNEEATLPLVLDDRSDVAIGSRFAEVAGYGESKLQGRKAVKLVLTVVGTLAFFGWGRRRRS